MIKKKITLLVAMAMLTLASVASAANKAETFSVTPVVGAYLFDGKQHMEANDMYGARVGYNFTDAFGVEALFDYSHNNKSTNHTRNAAISMYRYGGELLYHFMPANKFVPYVAAGYAGVNFDCNGDGYTNKCYKSTRGAFDYGVGAKYFVTENIALRGDVRHIIYKYDRTYSNLETTVGAYFAFGGAEPAAKPVEPEAVPVVEPVVVPVAAPMDSDGDGVTNALDKCPNTPAGVVVDKNGCPLDSDKDGVADYLDKCPNTPTGVAVDTKGCPLDSDKDGVPDYLDKCPNTPIGTKVRADGCPEVVAMVAAAERFCSKPAVVAVNFDTNMSNIKSQYYDELKTLGDFLVYYPNAKGEISGHADITGNKAKNLVLSQERADSVKAYIVDTFGVDAARIDTKGYGVSKPVASNKTKAGRAKNRRIETNFTCE